ncbi:TPA: S-(hydroxymethyl)glutathione synthase [Klebsiella pneumoniae]|nr:S-(hydroxymethyl)glutathione synthase [Klebsiella pneumoniae]
MNGSCLCGTIEFELTHKPAVFYRCHCSLCRKQSGVGYNLATLVKDSEFRWIKGENCIASWSKPTGYRTDFCNVCGSTVPNSLRDVPYVWVPVGLIDERLEMECAGDFCTDDAMPWDETRSPSCHAGPVESLAFAFKVPETQFLSVSIWHKADVKTYSIGKLLNAASAAWRRQIRLHVSVESNGAESPA